MRFAVKQDGEMVSLKQVREAGRPLLAVAHEINIVMHKTHLRILGRIHPLERYRMANGKLFHA